MKRRGQTPMEDKIADLLGEPRPQRSEERAEVIQLTLLAWVADGKTLNKFCEQKGAPTPRTIHTWLDQDLAFAEEYRTSRAIGFDVIAQDCLVIADEGGEHDVRHRGLRIKTRLQLLARWDSVRYGDKIRAEVSGLSDADTMGEILKLLAVAKTRQLQRLVSFAVYY